MRINQTTVEDLTDKIDKGEKFRFLRFGDGEWFCVLGKPKMIGRNEHTVFKEVTEDLRYIVSNLKDEHIKGIQKLSVGMRQFKGLIPNREWENADVLHQASINGELCPFIQSLQGKRVAFVGSEDLQKMKDIIPFVRVITVRKKDSYLDKVKTLRRIDETDADIFLLCASRLSVPLAYHSKKDATFIDCGSLFDVFIGKPSRGYQDKMSQEIIKKNLCQ